MFLPRATSTSSSSTTKPDNKVSSNTSPKRYGMMKTGAGQGAAWTQPSTASASVQVHYHYLAGRYRDLSDERGLGLSSSGSISTLGGILEGECDDTKSIEGDARSINLQASPNGKAISASSSLRAIARKTGVEKKTSSSTNRLQDLFGGGIIGLKDKKHNGISPTKIDLTNKRKEIRSTVALHGSKYSSLRSYAEERIKAQELIESRIERATDTGRLKWEARTAMLNSSFALATLLYTRAAQLGSISAALSLAHLYATGLTRGNKPMVVLVYRDPLRSLSWALEASRLLQQRTSAREKKHGSSSTWSKTELEQPAEIVNLLARLLRSRQAGLSEVSEVKLPIVRKRRSGKEKEQSAGLVWESVCESMEWLDKQVAVNISPVHDDGHSIGPDDDESDPEAIKELQARTQIALIEALVASRRWTVAQVDDVKGFSQAESCWKRFAEVLRNEGSPPNPTQGNLSMVCLASEDFLKGKKVGELVDLLDKSVAECGVPVVSTTAITLSHLESPSKRRAGQLTPVDTHVKKSNQPTKRPSLLNHQPSSEVKPTTSLAFGVIAPAIASSQSFSLQGSSQVPGLTSSASMARLESITVLPRQKDKSTLQRARRPSSVMSASPSLLFPTQNEEHERGSRRARQASRDNAPRKRVVSLYAEASTATSEKVNTLGSTTAAFEVGRQPIGRRRGDSNASIASMLTTVSISASTTGSEFAKGFLSPSPSSNTFDFRNGGAANSLRRIRKASISNQFIPTAPHLSDTLEDIIANSASYRAANAKLNGPQATTRTRRDSNASMKSLTAFPGNNQRQTSYGDMRPPSLFQGRASSVLGKPSITALRSPTLSLSTSYFNTTPQNANGTLQSRSRAPSHGALGSLRLIGRQFSSQSEPISKQDNDTIKQGKHKFPSLRTTAASTITASSTSTSINQRSFAVYDPTHTSPVLKSHSKSASPAGSIHHHINNGINKNKVINNDSMTTVTALDPTLAEAEDRSGLKTTSICMVCQVTVVNAPVSKSGNVFCSRSCRIKAKDKGIAKAKA